MVLKTTNGSSFSMSEFLRSAGGCAVIDGGLATELEANGADLNDPLWSAKCLIHSPELIRKVSPSSSFFPLPHIFLRF
ncbi:homocysteine S-methyltransferase 2-like [Iris pallida]|uniref:Homocysteine S-methyltransferase 2-like n=1 Tax=Iris pallida TaxID=29817 RepID=A0AAX6E998_IRIPA|nr:homocysteine S-methyltransferase 2-like [Iris pallida]